MDKRDQVLLAKQLWAVSSPPQNSALVGLMIVAVFLVGIGSSCAAADVVLMAVICIGLL
jgi:hypothetical protein